MWQIVVAILAIGALVFLTKVAILLLFLAGLIFRTKETVGLIAILAVIAGFSAHPLIGIGLIAVLVPISLYFKRKEKAAAADGEKVALPSPDD